MPKDFLQGASLTPTFILPTTPTFILPFLMLKNAFKKPPPQNRTNVQIKGGGGQRPFEQCSKRLHFSYAMASLTPSRLWILPTTPTSLHHFLHISNWALHLSSNLNTLRPMIMMNQPIPRTNEQFMTKTLVEVYRVVFLTGPPLKMTKCQITCKSFQKSSVSEFPEGSGT